MRINARDESFVVSFGEAYYRHGNHTNNEDNENAAEGWVGCLSVITANVAVSDLRVSRKAVTVDSSLVLLSLALRLVHSFLFTVLLERLLSHILILHFI